MGAFGIDQTYVTAAAHVIVDAAAGVAAARDQPLRYCCTCLCIDMCVYCV